MGGATIEAVDVLTTLIVTGIQDYAILQQIAAKIQEARATNTDLTSDDINAIRTMRDQAIKAFDDDIASKEAK